MPWVPEAEFCSSSPRGEALGSRSVSPGPEFLCLGWDLPGVPGRAWRTAAQTSLLLLAQCHKDL